jgi:hypothetical protein
VSNDVPLFKAFFLLNVMITVICFLLGMLFMFRREGKTDKGDEYASLRKQLEGSYDIIIEYGAYKHGSNVEAQVNVYKLTDSNDGMVRTTAKKCIYRKTTDSQSYRSPTQVPIIRSRLEAPLPAMAGQILGEIISDKTKEKPNSVLLTGPEVSEIVYRKKIDPRECGPEDKGNDGLYSSDI